MKIAIAPILLALASFSPCWAAPAPSKAALDDYVREHRESHFSRGEPLDSWEDALVAALARSSPDQAATALAGRFGLSTAQMRELVTLWLHFQASGFPEPTAAQNAEARQRILALLGESHRAPLVVEAASASLASDQCPDAEAFDLVIRESADRAGEAWPIARAAGFCAPILARFVATVPDKALPALIDLAAEDWLSPGDALPLLAFLTSPAALARIDPGHREAVARYLTDLYLAALLRADLVQRAVALYDSMPPEWRTTMLAGNFSKIAFTADGLPVAVEDYTVNRDSMNAEVRVGLAAALVAAGRRAEAENLFAAFPDLAATRKAFACASAMRLEPKEGPSCDRLEGSAAGVVLLDHLLHRAADDPYPIAATFFSGMESGDDSGVVAEIACLVFAEPAYRSLCQGARDTNRFIILHVSGSETDRTAAKAILAAARIPGFDEARSGFAADLAAVAAKGDAARDSDFAGAGRTAIDPDAPAFAPMPVPAGMRGNGAAVGWSKSFSPLPGGYQPVRIARAGNRVAVVSLSQNYDPTGEVTPGGYWIHLSDDGGRSWRRPLYTGLADHFPYVVVPNPRLPLFDGDVLNLAVEIKELDTRSITYPPVGLTTRRSQGDLYLRIPIADLERDSDGDGLTDLAARHLLLAADDQASPTPFVVGRAASGQCATPRADLAAMQAVLQHIFSVRTGAIIVPPDRDPNDLAGVIGGSLRIDPNSADRPIFVEGDPADYACLKPDRLMIVYRPADFLRLRRMTPDFHAVRLQKIVWNRAHDRGYLIWSTGWTGGTFELRRTGAGWTLATISSWIT